MKYCLHIQNKFEPIVYCQHPLFDMGTNQLLFVFRKYPCILTGRVWGKSNQEVWLVVVLNSFSTNQLGRKLHRCLCKSCKLFLNKSGSSNFVELYGLFETWRFLYPMKSIVKTFFTMGEPISQQSSLIKSYQYFYWQLNLKYSASQPTEFFFFIDFFKKKFIVTLY